MKASKQLLNPKVKINGITTYVRIQVPLPPKPPGTPTLPSALFFDVDSRFSQSQRIRIRNVIVSLIGQWVKHYVEKNDTGTSQLAMCCQRYANRGLNPVWSKKRVTNGLYAANQAMDVLTQRFIENGTRRVPVAKIHYYIPRPGGRFGVRAKTATRRRNVSLTVAFSPTMVGDLNIPNLFIVGSLIHAWLHRCGYTHPIGIYTSWLSAELPMCIMRGYQNKVAGDPDTNRTRFFD